jgi:restriction system protein
VLLSIVSPDGAGTIEGLNALLGGLLLVGMIVAIALVAWRLWRRLRTPTAWELSRRFGAVRSMSGGQFEVFVADLFRAMGHKAVVLGGSGDQGVDVIVNRRGERVAVQCKNHGKAVGNKPVQEVYAGARHHRCVRACVVAPAGYTKGATDLARSTGVSLFDANSIQQWIRKVDKLEGERERTSGTQTKSGHSHTGPAPASEAAKEVRKRAIWHPHPDDPPKA